MEDANLIIKLAIVVIILAAGILTIQTVSENNPPGESTAKIVSNTNSHGKGTQTYYSWGEYVGKYAASFPELMIIVMAGLIGAGFARVQIGGKVFF